MFDKNTIFVSNIIDNCMEKDLIKVLITEYQNLVAGIKLVPRPYSFEDNLNYVLVGLRRAGKSYLMYQRIQKLIQYGYDIKQILYFNFEDDRLINVTLADLDLIKTCYEEMYDCKPVFFLDEIQNVDGWEKFARRLADQKYTVYITGSNAKMLSSEISTTLGGRYEVKTVFPYSFSEYLFANGVDISATNTIYSKRKEIEKLLEDFFHHGGLPEITDVQDKRSWLSGLYNKIFFGDIVARYGIRNDFALKILVKKLAESVKQPSSYTRLTNVVNAVGKVISKDSVIDYVNYLSESWLILPFENLSAKIADKMSNRKYYFIDNGLLSLFLIDANTSLLENIVAVQLRRCYGDDACFYCDSTEVDYVLHDHKTAIQVSYSLTADPETAEREVKALLDLPDYLGIEKRIIVTKEEERTIERNGRRIEVLPLWKWLLS